ncbi:MAG: AAA family ATPase [Actinomycetia bacterium]|nr:AAA family ATPase [Actinomycetes bacterium]
MIDNTQYQSIIGALRTWDRQAMAKRVAEATTLREEFAQRYPIAAWPSMPVDDYALGQGNNDAVSYWLEFKTRPVASMSGGSAHKHLIFRRAAAGVWQYPSEYSSIEQAWSAVRAGFVEMLDLASTGQLGKTDDVKVLTGAQAVRAKLLYLYFPNDLIPVTSKEAIDHFLQALGETPLPSVIRANRQLLTALRAVPELSALSTQELGYFVYHWNDPRPSMKVVKIAPGELAKYWDNCRDNNYICVGWDQVGDLAEFDSKDAFREVFREHFPYNGAEPTVSRKANELWTLRELQPGDKVIANRGTSELLAIGTVNETGYQWRPERPEYRHTVGVDWDTDFARDIRPVKAWATTTVSKVAANLYRDLLGAPDYAPTVEPDRIYLNLQEALKRRGQAVLYGPPGTGKTYTARRAAVWLLDGGGTREEATALLGDEAALAEREKQLSTGRAPSRRAWFVVANPSQWSWSNLFAEGTVDYRFGRLQRNYPNVRAGDLVVGYESTPSKRVMALARVTAEYDAQQAPTITLEPVIPVENGLTYEELQEDPILAESEPIRFRCQGTLFALSQVEADHLLAALGERDPRIASVTAPSVQRLTRITFHPSYAYEDFIEGFRPKQNTDGGMALDLVDGLFKRVCSAAQANPSLRYILLIDEINRGNIPKIFGEMITVIEKDKRGLTVQLPQSGTDFAVPPNVWIIGTMNTADRSVQLLDSALRRRFAFLELLPESDRLAGSTAGGLALDTFLEELNLRIRQRFGREKQIGHAMFLSDDGVVDTPEAFASMFYYELLPLLQEYLYDDYTELRTLLGDVIDAATQRIAADVEDDPEALCAKLAATFDASASA